MDSEKLLPLRWTTRDKALRRATPRGPVDKLVGRFGNIAQIEPAGRADTISEYVSMAKAELSVRYGFAIAGDPQRLPAVVKALRRERPQADRRERRGVRRRH